MSALSRDAPAETRERARAYIAGLLLMAAGFSATLVLRGHGAETMAPMVGAVAVTAWYGGLRPALLMTALGWGAAWFAFLEPTWSWRVPPEGELLTWTAPLVVALLVVWVSWALQRAGVEATVRAESAEREQHLTAAVQRLAGELSSALTPTDVAHTLVERLPGLLGSTGVALGLVDGEALRIVDPEGAPLQSLTPGMSLSLDSRAPLTVAARTGTVAAARTRAELESEYPDGARLAPGSTGALGVPLRSGGVVVGSMGFAFHEPDAIDDEVVALAQLAADLGGQALERARLYERERRSRETLDRVALLAPHFGAESPEAVLEMVCTEARQTFGADVAQVWAIEHDEFNVLWREPPSAVIPPGTMVNVSDFPGLAESIRRLQAKFITDSWTEITGLALEHARRLGIRSSLRVPIAVGSVAERVLVLQWTSVRAEPPPSEIVLARRFADLAGLALEHAERRVAQTAASRNAEETRRLLDVTGSLAATLEPASVADATLREAFRSLGASAGAVVRLLGERELELVAARGYPERALAGWQRFDLESEVPLCDAVRRNEIVALESPAEWARRYPGLSRLEAGHAAWLALPLAAGGRVVGGLALSFAQPRSFADGDREFALALSRQAGQALERASLLETEHGARMHAERMASDLAQLHALATALGRAGTADDVTRVVSDQIVHGVGAEAAGVFVMNRHPGDLVLASVGGRLRADDLADQQRLSLSAQTPIADAVRLEHAVWLLTEEDWAAYPETTAWRSADWSALGAVPLVVQQTVIGVLFALFGAGRAPSDADRRFIETVARQAGQPLERVRLLEEERASRHRAERANQQIRRLQTVTESLAAAPTASTVAEVMVGEGRAVLSADGALVHVLDRTSRRLQLLASAGIEEDVLELLRSLDPEAETPISEACRRGVLVEAPGLAAACGSTSSVDAPFDAVLCVPLAVGGDVLGVVTVGFGEERHLDDDDRRTALIMGRQCAQALERGRLFDEEREARDRADRLQHLTTALSGALTPGDVVGVFLRQGAPAVGAHTIAVGLVDQDGRIPPDTGWQGDASFLPYEWVEPVAGAVTPLRDSIRSGSLYFDDADDLLDRYPGVELGEAARQGAIAFVPLVAGRKPYAVTVLVREVPVPFDEQDRAFIEAISGQCGQALDRAQRYETERTIAETLQRSVLPETLPSMEGATVAARYLPGTAAIDVGGDWFDTILLPDGRLGFVVGDVVGKGVQAASTMAQLRNGMRALTLDSSNTAAIVTKLNRLLDGYTDAPFATLAFLTVEPRTHETTLISAGHLPPLVLSPTREPQLLDGGRGLPLGVDPDATYEAWTTILEPGSVIVLYTDGLVERRDRPLDEGLALLVDATRDVDAEPEELVDLILERLIGGHDRGDDVAVLVVALDRAPLGTFAVHLPADRDALVELRHAFGRWLERGGISEADRRDLMLATWEASANAIEHARDPSRPVIEVEATLSGDKVRVEVSDHGRWTEPRQRPDRGLGLHLIQSLMTSLTVDPGPDGTRVVMERALSRERVGEGS